ncbi:MAG TPA: BamA/TamA family outer membrane protein, partial [Methylibium sp.]|nr:BamA/TamA family outer membrane protein [Methylibium sp.]
RNVVQIGSEPAWFTEWYQPLGWTTALGSDWFLAPSAQIVRSERVTYVDPEGPESGRLRRTVARLGLDLGQPWGEFGELRLGLYAQRLRDKPLLVREGVRFDPDATDRLESGLRLRAVIDQLDYVAFPQAGYRLVGEVAGGRLRSRLERDDDEFVRIEASGELASTWAGAHTVNLYASTRLAGGAAATGLGLYTLGGFQNLSGYEPGQVQGNYLAFGRLSYYYRLAPPALTRGFFAGASLEAGNVWSRRREASLDALRYGGSVFLGADTGLGPLYVGVVYAPRGDTGLYLFLGRP